MAGLGLAAFRADVVASNRGLTRLALSGGFAALAVSAFVHGSLLRASAGDVLVVVSRGTGIIAIGGAAFAWRDRRGRWMLGGGVVAVALGLALSMAHSDFAAASVGAVGAAAIGAALLLASRRAIAARVAASAAATLLLVVLVLALGLSVVLQSTVQDQAVASIGSRARVESGRLEDLRAETTRNTRLLQAYLIQGRDPSPERDFASLVQTAARGTAVPALADLIQNASDSEFSRLPVAYASAGGARVPTRSLGDSDLQTIVRSAVFADAIRDGSERGEITVSAGRAVVIAAVAVRADGEGVVGAVVAAYPIDRTYLLQRTNGHSALSLALIARSGVVASVGKQPEGAARALLVRNVLTSGRPSSLVVDGRFVAAEPVGATNGRAVVVLVASSPATGIDLARLRLYRTFFLIALGGAVVALLIATVVGERIGGGVRRLTVAAGAVQAGDLEVRTKIRSDDEIGVLSAAFDSMVASIQENNVALAQAAADESRLRNRLEAVVAGMGEALVAVDESGDISEFNAAAEELMGISAAAARGKPLATIVRLEAEDGIDLTARLAQPSARRWSCLATLTTEAGPIPVAMSTGALRGADGLAIGSAIVLRDLRGDQEVERMKREFLSRVGHELRTPLTPIIGYAKILASRDLPRARVREVMGEILELANRQFRIVEMLEFFASIEAGRDVFQLGPVNIAALLDGIVDGRDAAATSNVITRRVRRGTPDVLADAHWLNRAVDELVDNAIKFSPAGAPVRVTAEVVDDVGRRVVKITVTDKGNGISPEQVDAAFGEFAQGDESDTRAFGGLGLGLPLARRVAERLGGRVTCESTLGMGSKFSVLIPVAAATD